MLCSLKDLEKCSIGATDGDVGQVSDLYFDDQAWTVRYLIVETGSWLSGRKVLISPVSMHKPDWPAHRLPAAISREQVENSPDIDTDQPVSRQHELQVLDHYGHPKYWDASGLWGGGMVPTSLVAGDAALPGGAVEREQPFENSAENSAADELARHRHDEASLRSCTAVIGYHLHATDGEVGHVEGFLIDDETWAIRYLVVNTSNWWLGHQVLIAPQWVGGIHWSDQTVSVDLDREAVKAAPPYDPSAAVDRPREARLYNHYGRPPYWQAGSTLEREI